MKPEKEEVRKGKELVFALQKTGIYERNDFESIRDNVEQQVIQSKINKATGINPEIAASYNNRDRGIKASAIINQSYDHGTNQEDINKAINKVTDKANDKDQKESKACDFITHCISGGYYGYLLLRKWLGITLEHPILKPWYGDYLSRIPSLINPGGEVKLLEGTYTLSAKVSMADDVTLSGCGRTATILKQTALDEGICAAGSAGTHKKNMTLENLAVDMNSKNNVGIYFYYSDNVKIRNVLVKNGSSFGMKFHSGDYGWMQENYILDMKLSGIVNQLFNNFIFSGNILKSCGNNTTKYSGIGLCCAANGVVEKNLLVDCDATSRGGIWVGEYYATANNLTIIGNIIDNCGASGIDFIGDGGHSYNRENTIIANNIIRGGVNTHDGISCNELAGANTGTVKRIFIYNNIIIGCNDWAIDFNAIHGSLTELFIRNNQLEGTNGNLRVAAAITNEIVKDNKGYNPVGISAISVGASEFTHTAGSSPETIYISGGTVSLIKKGTTTIFTDTGHSVELEPHELVKVTYSALPTMYKDAH